MRDVSDHAGPATSHAVVLGAGMSGLMAARVLSETYKRVTILERDTLPTVAEARRGVPQGRHVHGLLPRGEQILQELFPGLSDTLLAGGAVDCQALTELRFVLYGRVMKQAPSGHRVLQASRPFLEGHVRDRVQALPNVTFVEECVVLGVVATEDNSRVTGVRIRPTGGPEEQLAADLVVCALGRGARVARWLEDLGYESPAEEGVPVNMTYASQFLRLPANSVNGDKEIVVGVREEPRGMALFNVEGDRHILTLIGYAGDKAPTDPEGFLAFAATVAPPDVFAAIEAAVPLSDISPAKYNSNARRRYDKLARFPDGLLVFGDALCSFSPVYGQGMTASAMQAVELRNCLEAGPEELAPRFFRAAAVALKDAWLLTVIADLSMPHIEAPRSKQMRVAILGARATMVAAEYDAVVARQLTRVMGLMDPISSLLTPKILARVALTVGTKGAAREAKTAAGSMRRAVRSRPRRSAGTPGERSGPPDATSRGFHLVVRDVPATLLDDNAT